MNPGVNKSPGTPVVAIRCIGEYDVRDDRIVGRG